MKSKAKEQGAQKKHACPCKASHAINVADRIGAAAGMCGVGVLGHLVWTEHGVQSGRVVAGYFSWDDPGEGCFLGKPNQNCIHKPTQSGKQCSLLYCTLRALRLELGRGQERGDGVIVLPRRGKRSRPPFSGSGVQPHIVFGDVCSTTRAGRVPPG